MAFERHKSKEFWINLFTDVSEVLGIPYDSLRSKEVTEFFTLLKKFDKKLKERENGRQ